MKETSKLRKPSKTDECQIDKAQVRCQSLRSYTTNIRTVSYCRWVINACGRRSYYLYGASSNEFREFMPNHLMQWTMMQAAKASGAERYDFGGVSGRTEPDDEYAGLYAFKSGWGSDMIEKVGEFDLVLNRPLYFALETGLPLLKGLRKRFEKMKWTGVLTLAMTAFLIGIFLAYTLSRPGPMPWVDEPSFEPGMCERSPQAEQTIVDRSAKAFSNLHPHVRERSELFLRLAFFLSWS
jgi:hypothetical protein